MKTVLTFFTILVIAGFSAYAQELKFAQLSETELDKDARKSGRYGGTFVNGDNINVYYFMSSKKEGVQAFQYSFDNDLKFKSSEDKLISSADAKAEFAWYQPEQEVEKIATGNEKFIEAGAAFGSGMKITSGHIKKHYMLGIFTTWSYEQEEKVKPKAGDIWRVQPSGYKTTSDYNRLATTDVFVEDLAKYGFPLLAPASATLIAAGTITEKVSIKNPPPTNGNRVACLAINGMDFEDIKYNTYILPYSALTMGSGLGQNDDLTVLFAPLNAPSTYKPHKPLLWKNNKDYFTAMRFNDEYTLVDSTSFRSELMWGIFEIFNSNESTIITGLGKADFDGWARNAYMIGLKKIDAVQLTKVKDGKIIYSSMWDDDALEGKLVMPAGIKAKYHLNATQNTIQDIIPLPNGDDFVWGHSPAETYALQVSPDGELKAFYRFPRIDEKNSIFYDNQFLIRGDDLYVVLNEQPVDLSNETQVHVSTSRTATTTTTTTTVNRLNEVFVQSQVVRINIKTQEMSNTLVMDGKEFYPMGSYPALFKEDAIYFTGREKGPGGKVLYVGRVDL